MGRHIGSHTYSDTRCTIYQKIRNTGRHDGRLLQRVIEIVLHVNSLFLKVCHHVFTNFSQTTLCITHGSSAVTVY